MKHVPVRMARLGTLTHTFQTHSTQFCICCPTTSTGNEVQLLPAPPADLIA